MKKIYYRYAKLEDAKFLYNLRTSKDAKKFFFKKKNFTFKQHIIWLTNKISKKKDKLIVFYFKPQDYFGVVRYESIKNYISVSIQISGNFKKKGLGNKILKLSEKLLKKKELIISKIKLGNSVSIKLFKRNGYKEFNRTKKIINFFKIV